MTKAQRDLWELLIGLRTDTVLGLLTDYHGTQLLDSGFQAFVRAEIIGEDEEEDDE